ncbi:hypothetical protein V2J09_000335 [Rumex salicifolius]
MANVAAELIWLVCLLQDLNVDPIKPVSLCFDNCSAINRHAEIRFLMVCLSSSLSLHMNSLLIS